MLAASVFNQQGGTTGPVLGIVTSGEVWQFLRLDGLAAPIGGCRYHLDHPAGILGALQAMIAEARIHYGQAA